VTEIKKIPEIAEFQRISRVKSSFEWCLQERSIAYEKGKNIPE